MSIESKERGPEVAIQCAWLISGIAVAYWIDFGFTRMDSQISWVRFLGSLAIYHNLTHAPALPHCLPSILRPDFRSWNAHSARHATLVLRQRSAR